mgnify:CR=1 FL=1
MKRFLTSLFLFVVMLYGARGQMITTDPVVPTLGKTIKIYYDTSKDPGELNNYTGDIFAHTGLILEGSSAWQKVIGTWANNTTQPKLNYLGNYRYELVISPDIERFYNVLPGEKVKKIALVLRNSAGNRQTRPDIFIDVFETGLNVVFTLPEKYSFVTEPGTLIKVSASATNADSVSLFINNTYRKSGNKPDLLTDTIEASVYGEYWVKTVAWDLPASAADSFFFYVRKPVITSPLPDGLKDGINYTSDTSVTLVLHAPYKNYAFAVGDFTDWLACEKGYMNVTPDGERYWVEIKPLTPGKEYRFQYLVDSSLYIADPYADKVLDPFNDEYITESTYPGLIKYPKLMATGIVSVLQTSQSDYNWKSTSFKATPSSRLVIYELLVRDFIEAHDFKTLADTIGYLQRLGVNAIELMPVTEFEGNLSWGYNVSFYFAPDKYYGPKNSLKAFIDTCHSRGIAVIMDLVLNHSFGQSPFVQLYFDHYGTDEIVMKTPNPWFNAVSPNPVYKWGADFNHESPATRELVDRITSYWLTEYRVDGFRFDFTKGFTNTPGDGGAYDASRIAILKRMADRIWEVNRKAYVILEHFTANAEEKELAEYGMLIWGNMNYQYAEAAMGYSSDLSGVTHISRGWNVPNLVGYMESHDEERLMYKCLAYGASADSYNIKTLQTALKRMELAALFFLTVPGPKMIWQFGELGYDVSINFNGRTGNKPVLWNYYTILERNRLFKIYRLLIALRSSHEVFHVPSFSYSLSGKQKTLYLSSPEMDVTVVGNFDIAQAVTSVNFQKTGKWYEYFTGDSLFVISSPATITLQPGEYRLYTTVKLESPLPYLGTEDLSFSDYGFLADVYPNPSTGPVTFVLSLTKPSEIELSVFNSSGVAILHKERQKLPEGISSFSWDGRSQSGERLPAGLYFARFRSGRLVKTVKIVRN